MKFLLIENENSNRIWGGNTASVTSSFAIKLYILKNDYEKAYDIVCEYAQQKCMGIIILPKLIDKE